MKLLHFRHRGLRVTYQRHPGQLTALALTVRAGARFDGPHPGLAHLTEHMLFQGSATLDQLALNRRAAELGGEHNADTGYEDIALTFEVFNEDLDAALALLAEQFYRTEVDPPRLRKERRVVMEEIRGRLDDPAERLYRRAWARLFTGSLAHPVSGTIASVSRIGPGEVEAFIRGGLVHANAALAVVGGVEPDDVRAALHRHFRGEPGESWPAPHVGWGSGGRLRVRDPDSAQAYLTLLLPVAPEPRTLLATGVAVDIVGADPDSRLFQELRERLGLSYEVGAHLEWGPDWALAVIGASGARSRADRLTRAVEEICRRAAESGFGDDELDRARKKLRYRYAVLGDSRLDQAIALAESALWGFPTPQETQRIVGELSHAQVEDAWRRAVFGHGIWATLE